MISHDSGVGDTNFGWMGSIISDGEWFCGKLTRFVKAKERGMCCRCEKGGWGTIMNDGFLDFVICLATVAPGLVCGTVDIVCDGCSETSSASCNTYGSYTYICPNCGERIEI